MEAEHTSLGEWAAGCQGSLPGCLWLDLGADHGVDAFLAAPYSAGDCSLSSTMSELRDDYFSYKKSFVHNSLGSCTVRICSMFDQINLFSYFLRTRA